MDASTRTFFIAGVKFRPDYRLVQKELDGKDWTTYPISLIGEPSNQYDKYAVKIMAGGRHIGYVPKPINVDVWALRDLGYKPKATLVEYNPDAMTHEMFKVSVDFVKPPSNEPTKPV